MKKSFSKVVVGLLLLIAGIAESATQAHARIIDSARTERVRQLVMTEARAQGVPVSLALAVAHVESAFQPHVVSHAGARGVMQIMPATAKGEFGLAKQQLFNARVNVHYGVKFLKQLHKTYGRWDIALSHYNGGSAVRRKNGGLRIIPATAKYVRKVLKLEKHYARHLNLPSMAPSQPKKGVAYALAKHDLQQKGQTVTRHNSAMANSLSQNPVRQNSALTVAMNDMDDALEFLKRSRQFHSW